MAQSWGAALVRPAFGSALARRLLRSGPRGCVCGHRSDSPPQKSQTFSTARASQGGSSRDIVQCTESGAQRHRRAVCGTRVQWTVNSPLSYKVFFLGLSGHPWAATGLAHYARHTLTTQSGSSRTLQPHDVTVTNGACRLAIQRSAWRCRKPTVIPLSVGFTEGIGLTRIGSKSDITAQGTLVNRETAVRHTVSDPSS
jgi:hypothetical protein